MWQKLGFSPQTTKLIFIVPAVRVGWAEGFLQASERKTILRIADEIGISGETECMTLLQNWFEERPTDEFFSASDEILHAWLEKMSPAEAAARRNFILQNCFEVAKSSAQIGIFNRDNVRREEEYEINRIAEKFGLANA
jgi:hypothetical protein